MNEIISEHLKTISILYQIKGENRRYSSYARAAEILSTHNELITKDNVIQIYGIGKSLAQTILQFQETGTSDKYQELVKEIDPQCLSLLLVKGIGPKTAWKFYQSGIKNFDQLVSLWEAGKIDQRFSDGIKQAIERKGSRIHGAIVQVMGDNLLQTLNARKGVLRASLAGSVRRKKETSKDLDIILSAAKEEKQNILDFFSKLGKEINKGETKSSIWFTFRGTTIQTDLLVVDDESFGAALQYFTGSKEHNIKIRSLAQSKGFKVNELGIWDKNGLKLGGKNEEDIYNVLGIPMPNPEER